ncbi:glutamate 5-kinase [Panacagrimonas sp.]|uniref:glutamate 5-kinase n=1 Tax=Panacagrimonas sp. TaxID=2480088 RepID=UPI003B5159BD
MNRQRLIAARRWVVKIGSSLVTAKGRGLDHEAIRDWCQQIAELRSGGRQIVLVSSGAVAEGMARLGLSKRPGVLPELQAAAAVGQMGLVRAWELGFESHGLRAAQVLLTHEDVADRERYLNARATLKAILDFGAIPVVNENDTVSTDEIRLGDNDTLGAMTTNLIEAELLVILTDQDGLFEADPRLNPHAKLVSEIELSAPQLSAMAGESKGELGRGGMRTKLSAARIAARSGACTAIAHGRASKVLARLAAGESIGSLLLPDIGVMAARKRWIAGQLQARGRLKLDAGAAEVLRQNNGRSLLPVGVTQVEGEFERGDLVICLDPQGVEVARGLSNYASSEARRILGAKRGEILGRLGYPGAEELIHRDNMTVV